MLDECDDIQLILLSFKRILHLLLFLVAFLPAFASFFFLNDRPPTEISPLPQPAALPISAGGTARAVAIGDRGLPARPRGRRLREDPGGARHRRGPPLLDVPAGAEVVARR